MSGTLIGITLRDPVVFGTLTLPAGVIQNAAIADGTNISASKLQHRHAANYHQIDGTDVASETAPIHVVRGTTGAVVSIEAAVLSAPTGDATVTVDLQKSTAEGAFASILTTGQVVIDSDVSAREVVAGVIDSAGLVDGDILRLVVTASAGGGSLPQGLIVTVNVDEDAS